MAWRRLATFAVVVAAVAASFAVGRATRPPLPDKEPAMASAAPKVVWFEIPVTDLDRAIRFYERVLGARFERESVDGHEMALFAGTSDGDGIVGALAKGEVYRPAQAGPIVYFGVDDVDAVLDRARGLGAPVLYPKTAIGARGFVAEIGDSEGNRIALHAPAR